MSDRTDPGRTDPGRTDPGRTDPGRTDPGRPDRGRPDRGRTAELTADDPSGNGASANGAVRPAVDLAAIRAELSPAVISDVLDSFGLRQQCLAAGLAPLDPAQVLVGYAFPVHIERVYDVPAAPFRGLVAALDAIGPDEVFVTPTQRARDIAVWGELLSTACLKRGAAGALTDGLVRDSRAIRSLGFPVVSSGTIPYDSQGRHEIIRHRVPCVLDGVRIEPGDLIVADADGVAIVPQAVIDRTVAAAFAKRSSEREFRAAVAGDMSATEAFSKYGVL